VTPPVIPADEDQRQKALESLELVDSPQDERFDRFARLAKRIFDVPFALVCFVDGDRVWFKSRLDLNARQVPRNTSFCGHTILHDELLYVPDALNDERFSDIPLVTEEPQVRFYLGCPMTESNGFRVGTFCLIDTRPRNFSEKEFELFRDLAESVQEQIRQLGREAIYNAANASRYLLTENSQRLEEYEARFYNLVEGSLQGMMITTGDEISFVNPALADLLGYTIEDFQKVESWSALVAPEDRARVLGYCKDRANNIPAPTTYEYRGLRKDGTTVWLRNLSTQVVWNGQPAVQATVIDISAHKAVEKELVAEEARFRDFAESSSDWFWEMDENLRYTWFSERVEEFTDFPREWHYGKTRQELGIPEGQEELWAEHLKLLDERKPYQNFEYRREAPDGVRWVRSSGLPIFDQDGEFKGYRGTGIDITHEREIREAADDANKLVKTAINGLNETFSLWGPDDRLLLFNEKFIELNAPISDYLKPGITFTKFTRTALEHGVYEEAKDNETAWFRQRLRMHKNPVGQFEQKRANGTWLLINEQKISDGSTITISIDITARKQAEFDRLESEARFQDFARSSAERFWEMDKDLRFTWYLDMNRATVEEVKEDILGKTRWERAEVDPDSDPVWSKHKAELLERRPFRNFDYVTNNGDGSKTWWRISGVPIFDEAGEFAGYRGVGADVTAIKETERERDLAIQRAAEANAAKSVFLANMSHELRTPLNAIIGFSEVMTHQTFGEIGHPRYAEYAEDITASAQHLLSLIDEVLDISKIEAQKLDIQETVVEVKNVLEISQSMLGPQIEAKQLHFDVDDTLGAVRLRVDERMLRQVIINLLANAIKFTPDHGHIRISAGLADDGCISIAVADNGIGIPEGDIERVLVPFERVQSGDTNAYEGTGLGLPLSKRFVELHDGTLSLESTLGQGTTVTVAFPAARTIRPEQTAAAD